MSFPKNNNANTRKKYTPQFKFNLVKEAIKTGNISEVSRKYGVGVNLLSISDGTRWQDCSNCGDCS